MKHALWIAALAACTTSSHHDPLPPCGSPSPTDQLAQTQNQILALSIANGEVYWLDMGGIGKVSTDGDSGAGGTELVQATSGAAFALGGSITTHGNAVYWADGNFPAGSVDSVAMAGGASVPVASANAPTGVAVDDANIYWSDLFGGVSAVPIAGGAVRTLVAAQYALPPSTILEGSPAGIALADGVLYWTSTPLDGKSASTIQSVATSGGSATVIATLDTLPTGIAVDDSFVYWAEVGPVMSGSGLGSPPIANQGSIRRMAKDGSGAAQIVSSGATYPVGPVVDDNALYYSTGSASTTLYRVVM